MLPFRFYFPLLLQRNLICEIKYQKKYQMIVARTLPVAELDQDTQAVYNHSDHLH